MPSTTRCERSTGSRHSWSCDRRPRHIPATSEPPPSRRSSIGTPIPSRCWPCGSTGNVSFGFFPDHVPRLWEYPVAVGLVIEHLPAGSRLVDVGAGITPLAPFLTSRGYVVDTVDPSEIHRAWPPAQDWNEWGFLDYAEAGLGHRSWNCTLDELPESTVFDGVFSISVIEHIPGHESTGASGGHRRCGFAPVA